MIGVEQQTEQLVMFGECRRLRVVRTLTLISAKHSWRSTRPEILGRFHFVLVFDWVALGHVVQHLVAGFQSQGDMIYGA